MFPHTNTWEHHSNVLSQEAKFWIPMGAALLVAAGNGALWASQQREQQRTLVTVQAQLKALSQQLEQSQQCSPISAPIVQLDAQGVALRVAERLANNVAAQVDARAQNETAAQARTEEQKQQEESQEHAADSEASDLVAGMVGRVTSYQEWATLGQAISKLAPPAYQDAVRRHILVRVNRQELKPPQRGNLLDALDGLPLAE
jgi:uncharacterized membrane-anchored protein YhcB (DUF1043 family)